MRGKWHVHQYRESDYLSFPSCAPQATGEMVGPADALRVIGDRSRLGKRRADHLAAVFHGLRLLSEDRHTGRPGGLMFEDQYVELLPARTTMQVTVTGTGGNGGNGGNAGNDGDAAAGTTAG